MPGTSEGLWRKTLSPIAFSLVDLPLHSLSSHEEAHSPGASHTHQDGNPKLCPNPATFEITVDPGSLTLGSEEGGMFFLYNFLASLQECHHIIFPMSKTCPLPEGREGHLSCSQPQFLHLEQCQAHHMGSADLY